MTILSFWEYDVSKRTSDSLNNTVAYKVTICIYILKILHNVIFIILISFNRIMDEGIRFSCSGNASGLYPKETNLTVNF